MAAPAQDVVIPPTTPAERVNRILTALGCWFVAGCFLVAWWWPRSLDGGRWVSFGVGVMIFEFLTIHATGILTFGLRKQGRALEQRSWWWIVGMYALMGASIAFVFRSWMLLLSFAVLLVGRVRALLRPEDHKALVAIHRRVAISALLFLLLTLASVLIPMPAGGIDAALLRDVWPNRGSGLWETHPQQALAMGFAYFLLLGWFESRAPGTRWYTTPLPQPTQD